MTDPRIEESRITSTELAHQRIERHHFGGEIRGNGNRLPGGEDVEFVRIKNDRGVFARVNRIPEVERIVNAARIDIDDTGMAASAPTDLTRHRLASEVGAQCEPAFDIRRSVDKPHFLVP